jgi:hypothetical protein
MTERDDIVRERHDLKREFYQLLDEMNKASNKIAFWKGWFFSGFTALTLQILWYLIKQ